MVPLLRLGARTNQWFLLVQLSARNKELMASFHIPIKVRHPIVCSRAKTMIRIHYRLQLESMTSKANLFKSFRDTCIRWLRAILYQRLANNNLLCGTTKLR